MPVKEVSGNDINCLSLFIMKLKKIYALLATVITLLLMNVAQLKAQGLPCGDPDLDCPIDGAVIFLVAAILFLSIKKITAIKLVSK